MNTTPEPMPYMDALAAAQDAARRLAKFRKPEREPVAEAVRRVVFGAAVEDLRDLWRRGDARQKALVAARVSIHLNPHRDGIMVSYRTWEREARRLKGEKV